ncbi:MAG: hypothetical protein V1778_01280 [bacterium]
MNEAEFHLENIDFSRYTSIQRLVIAKLLETWQGERAECFLHYSPFYREIVRENPATLDGDDGEAVERILAEIQRRERNSGITLEGEST